MSSLQFGDFVLDRRLRELRRGDTVLSIPGKAFDLLSYMAANAGRPLTKSELLDAVWPETTVEESNLTQNVFLLRKVLGSGGDGPIKTLAGRGYQFAAEITEVEPAAQPNYGSRLEDAQSLTMQATQTRVVVRHEVEESSSRLRWLWVVLSLMVLAALGVLGWKWRQRWLDRTGGPPVQVVLMPMEGTTGDPMLDKSLTQAMRMDLAQSPYVSVVPRSTVRTTLTQMMHKPDDVMIPAMAREVCERTNSQGILSSDIAKVGQHYLITEEATNCVDGTVVAEEKYEAAKVEELPHGFDKLGASLRQKLGESRRSIARFSTPLIAMNTASLEALKNYTQATILSGQGKFADAIVLEKKAIELDPNFAAARFDLAAYYMSVGDFVNARAAVMQAHEVVGMASEPVRLAITSLYETYSTEDLFAAERNYRSWTELYPRSPQAWNGLSMVQRDLGQHAESAASSLRAIPFVPNNMALYENAAFEQLRAGDALGAKKTLDSAIAHNLDGDRIRETYFEVAFVLNDSALLQTQRAWIDSHPQASGSRIQDVDMAIGQGRFNDAHRLLAQTATLFRQQGLSDLADLLTKNEATNMTEAGDREAGIRIFHSAPFDPENSGDLQELVEIGDFKTAAADLKAMEAKYPQGTLWNQYWGPLIEAMIAMANHKPQEAIAIMEVTRQIDERDLDTHKLRGDAYLAAGQPSLAEKEYRAVIAHRDIDLLLGDYPLSWLGLGEALAAEGNRAAAIDAYQHFFTLWAHADPDAMYLKQAKQEFVKLQSTP